MSSLTAMGQGSTVKLGYLPSMDVLNENYPFGFQNLATGVCRAIGRVLFWPIHDRGL